MFQGPSGKVLKTGSQHKGYQIEDTYKDMNEVTTKKNVFEYDLIGL